MSTFVYADNAATTKMSPVSLEAMLPYMESCFGNPSSLHSAGQKAKEALTEARGEMAALLGCSPKEIYFTSGGSEADNQAILSAAALGARKGKKHILSTAFEHHAVLHTLEKLKREGFQVELLDVHSHGNISAEEVRRAIREDTCLVTVMYANNEIGSVLPIAEIGEVCREKGVIFHTDAVQAAGHLPIDVGKEHIDMLSLSAHKFHGPKGVGFLYVRDGVTMPSFIHGGSQERGKRAGTENVPGIVGMGKAVELAFCNMRRRIRREMMLRNYLIEKIMHEIKGVRLNGHPTNRLPGNVNVSFSGVDGASLLILLYEDGICASGGSACNTGEERVSYVIGALGVPDEYAAGTVRMTLSGETTREEIDRAVEALKQNLRKLRDEK